MVTVVRMDEPIFLSHDSTSGHIRFGLINNLDGDVLLDFVSHTATEVAKLDVLVLPRAIIVKPGEGVQFWGRLKLSIDTGCRRKNSTQTSDLVVKNILNVYEKKSSKELELDENLGEEFGLFREKAYERLALAFPLKIPRKAGSCSSLMIEYTTYPRSSASMYNEVAKRVMRGARAADMFDFV